MVLNFKNYKEDLYLPKFQQGGEIPAEQAPEEEVPVETAPAEVEQDPMAQLMLAAAQALLTQDCQMAMQVCQFLVQAAQPAEKMPQEQPVYKMGGKLSRRIKRD